MNSNGKKNRPRGKPWPKGVSGNPEGGRLHDPVRRELKKITRQVWKEVIECALTQNVVGLRKIAKDPDTPAMQVGIATALGNSIVKGDWATLRSITEQIIGKEADTTAIRFPDGLPVSQPQTTITKVILTLPKNGSELKKE